MAHKMSRKLARKPAAVRIAPEQFGGCAVLCYPYDTEVVFGVDFNVLKIFARTGNDKYFTDKRVRLKAGGYCANDLV